MNEETNSDTPDNEQPLNEAESANAEKADDKAESSETTKTDENWFIDRTEETLRTGHTFMPGLRDMDPDQP